jgi:SAM-dependent methyltransferase
MILAPGTILQRMYLRERLAHLAAGRFVEVGVGGGTMTDVLLDRGWTGIGYEVSAEAARLAAARLDRYIRQGRFTIQQTDWLSGGDDVPPADLIISSMVLEHLSEADEREYFRRCERTLGPAGLAILIVPASPTHWGIEDEVAGHYRRYTSETMRMMLRDVGWEPTHIAGLTFPVSNLLLPVSNALVARTESHKCSASMAQRTRASGHRTVPLKTAFPRMLGLVLNELVLYPAHLLQKLARRHAAALVLYVEARPARTRRPAATTR